MNEEIAHKRQRSPTSNSLHENDIVVSSSSSDEEETWRKWRGRRFEEKHEHQSSHVALQLGNLHREFADIAARGDQSQGSTRSDGFIPLLHLSVTAELVLGWPWHHVHPFLILSFICCRGCVKKIFQRGGLFVEDYVTAMQALSCSNLEQAVTAIVRMCQSTFESEQRNKAPERIVSQARRVRSSPIQQRSNTPISPVRTSRELFCSENAVQDDTQSLKFISCFRLHCFAFELSDAFLDNFCLVGRAGLSTVLPPGYSVGYRSLEVNLGVRMLQGVLGCASPVVPSLCEFLLRSGAVHVTRDQWTMIYAFCCSIDFPQMTLYHAEDCWPCMIDSFVEWSKTTS